MSENKSDILIKNDDMGEVVGKNLHKSRTVMIVGGITDVMAQNVCAKLLSMSAESDEPITIFVNSPGGHVESGDMIHDMIKFITPKVRIIGSGYVASAGALIYVSVDKDQRYALPNTRFLLHQPSGGVGGMASDIRIQRDEIVKMRTRLNQIFVLATGQTLKQIEKDTDRDFWLDAEEAIDYGLVGKIISNVREI